MDQIDQKLQTASSNTSFWKDAPKISILSKVIRLDKEGHALILKEDPSKPLRFLYLALLMSKKNSYNLNILLQKIGQIKLNRKELPFINMSAQMVFIGKSTQCLQLLLIELQQKMEKQNHGSTAILKLAQQFQIVDPLLILSLRAVAQDYKMINALDCDFTLTLGQIQFLQNKFFVDKGALTNSHNKYILFWSLTQIQCEYFKGKGIKFESQGQNYTQIADWQQINCQQFIMIEKVFSLL